MFFTDDEEHNILNFDGTVTECYSTADEMCKAIGRDINEEIDHDAGISEEVCFGYRIDYTLTPIRTDPFK